MAETLIDREAITDCVYRAVAGIDTHDMRLFDSAFIGEDAAFHFAGGASLSSLSAMHGALEPIARMDTTHTVSNVRIAFDDGRDTARLTATAVAQHYAPDQGLVLGAPHMLAGSLYDIAVVKIHLADGKEPEWRIKSWSMRVVWRSGDPSVVPQHLQKKQE